MNTSDIIAIVAIVVSAIVSISAGIISYKANKATIEARRSEMAFEKQIEAFREIAEKMSGIRKVFIDTPMPSEKAGSVKVFYTAVRSAILEFVFTYQKYRVYLPSELDLVLREFGKKAISYFSKEDYDLHEEFVSEFNEIEQEIIKIMNKYMGIN